MQHIVRYALLAGVMGAVGLWSSGTMAAAIPFQDAPISYQLSQKPLGQFLQQFFADQGLPVVLSDRVKSAQQTLNGPLSGTPAEVFRLVAKSNQLVPYYDGNTVYIYKASETESRYFDIPSAQMSGFRQVAERAAAGAVGNSYRVTSGGMVVVRGVPRFTQQLAKVAQVLGARPQATPSQSVDTVFRFFELEYAWASNRTFVVGNRKIKVPGVASILQRLVGDGMLNAGSGNMWLPASRPSLRGSGLAAVGAAAQGGGPLVMIDGLGMYRGEPNPAPRRGVVVPAVNAGPAQIVAVPYRNAVIVRDVPERMPFYHQLINALDVRPKVIELRATILQVNTQRLRELGVEWRFATDDFESMFGGKGTKLDFLQALGVSDVALLDQIPGFQIGAIIGDEENLIARINALQTEGAVRVLSRPQVLTLNNLPAVLESAREVYVPVEGAFEVDLFNVYAGTVLRVTPHVIDTRAWPRIRLSIGIQDGDVKFSEAEVFEESHVPIVTRTAINTQAIIDVGKSLLLGGLTRNSTSTTTSKVPILGDIPLIGRLFRSDTKDRNRMVRLFLITPRLVDPSGGYVEPDTDIPAVADNASGNVLVNAETAVRQARTQVLGGSSHLLSLAEDKLQTARGLVAAADRSAADDVRIRRLAREAELDARLARLKARERAARQKVDALVARSDLILNGKLAATEGAEI